MSINVTVWNEYVGQADEPAIAEHYPDGIHATVAAAIENGDREFSVRTATLEEGPEHGLTEAVIAETDVLVWWGHQAHDEVRDEVVDRVQQAVLDGMGFVPLHSSHLSRPFRRLMGTSCILKWDEADERERLWVTDPAHPVAEGLPEHFEVEPAEMYGEFFDIPQPDATVFTSWFEGGEVFRSGCAYHRGRGRIFYFRPGHETYPVFHNEDVQQVIRNACDWAAAAGDRPKPNFHHVEDRLESVGE